MDCTARAGPRPGPARPLSRALAAAALCGLFALAASGLWASLSSADAFRIRAIRFQGLERASEAELLALSPVKPGDDLLGADLDAVERALERHPWVRSARVSRRWPPALEARISERDARALVDLGGLYLVDRDAQVFKRAAAGDGLDLPVVTGFTRDDYVERRAELEPLLAGALALSDAYGARGLAARAPISEIHVDADEGLTLYLGEEGTQVRLGIGDLPEKLGRLERVFESLRAAGRRPEVLHLDDRNHPSRVTVRLAGRTSRDGPRGP